MLIIINLILFNPTETAANVPNGVPDIVHNRIPKAAGPILLQLRRAFLAVGRARASLAR